MATAPQAQSTSLERDAVDLREAIFQSITHMAPVYYWRRQRGEFNVLLHGVIPILGVLAFIPALFAGAGLPVFSFIPRLPHPISLAGLIMGSWMVLGVVYLVVLYVRDPARVRATDRVFLEEDPEELRAGEPGPPLTPAT